MTVTDFVIVRRNFIQVMAASVNRKKEWIELEQEFISQFKSHQVVLKGSIFTTPVGIHEGVGR